MENRVGQSFTFIEYPLILYEFLLRIYYLKKLFREKNIIFLRIHIMGKHMNKIVAFL